MPGILQEQIAIMNPLLAMRFPRHTVAASLTASALNAIDTNATSGALNVAGEVAPFAGSIVGLSAAASAGSLTLDVTINGTVTGFQVVLTTSPSGSTIMEYGQPGFRFNAGDTFGVKITTNAAWKGTPSESAGLGLCHFRSGSILGGAAPYGSATASQSRQRQRRDCDGQQPSVRRGHPEPGSAAAVLTIDDGVDNTGPVIAKLVGPASGYSVVTPDAMVPTATGIYDEISGKGTTFVVYYE